jgi:hypothetical protein
VKVQLETLKEKKFCGNLGIGGRIILIDGKSRVGNLLKC